MHTHDAPPRTKPLFIGSGILWAFVLSTCVSIYATADWWNPVPNEDETLKIFQHMESFTVIVTIGTFGLFLNIVAALIWWLWFSFWAHHSFKKLGY